MIVSIADVKINGQYNHIQSVAPTVAEKAPTYLEGDVWLDIVTGYSYELIDQTLGTWVRIELDLDARITRIADNTTLTIMRELSNYFIVDRNDNYTDIQTTPFFPNLFTRREQYNLMVFECIYSEWTFAAAGKTITVGSDVYGTLSNFVSGDTLYISGSLRNDGFYTIDTITSTIITVTEDIVNGTENAFIYLSIIPQSFKNIVGAMIYYDQTERLNMGPYQSERIGTYSYTLGTYNNGLNYPDHIINGIEAFNNVAMGGVNVFIN